MLQNLIDEKALEKNAKKKEEEQLRLQVQNLQKELAEKTFLSSGEEAASDDTSDDISAAASSDVVLRVRPEKAPLIKSEIIDGQKCLIIPVEEDEQVNVNGVDTIL